MAGSKVDVTQTSADMRRQLAHFKIFIAWTVVGDHKNGLLRVPLEVPRRAKVGARVRDQRGGKGELTPTIRVTLESKLER